MPIAFWPINKVSQTTTISLNLFFNFVCFSQSLALIYVRTPKGPPRDRTLQYAYSICLLFTGNNRTFRTNYSTNVLCQTGKFNAFCFFFCRRQFLKALCAGTRREDALFIINYISQYFSETAQSECEWEWERQEIERVKTWVDLLCAIQYGHDLIVTHI